jgi:hypothetical protein
LVGASLLCHEAYGTPKRIDTLERNRRSSTVLNVLRAPSTSYGTSAALIIIIIIIIKEERRRKAESSVDSLSLIDTNYLCAHVHNNKK